jgi:hypothetical protein
MRKVGVLSLGAAVVVLALGCGKSQDAPSPGAAAPTSAPAVKDEVVAERAKLSPEDRALVDAQEWCVVSPEERLGSMGPPLKLDIKGQPVFVCCKGCKRKAESEPEKTLQTAAELRAKRAAQPKQ